MQIKPPLTTSIINLPVYISFIGQINHQIPVNRRYGSYEWHIFFTLAGKGELNVNNKKYPLTTDNLVIIKSAEPHRYKAVSKEWKTGWILFSGKDINNLMMTLGIKETTVVKISDREFFSKTFYSLFDLCEKGYDSVTSSYLLYMLVCKISQWHAKQSETYPCDAILRATNYISWHYGKIINLKDIADFSRVSQQYLCRLFKKHFNMRPFEYVNKIRIEKAQFLLLNSDLKINEIAEKCCFDSPSYFAKKFKQHTGISPSQFMKYHKKI